MTRGTLIKMSNLFKSRIYFALFLLAFTWPHTATAGEDFGYPVASKKVFAESGCSLLCSARQSQFEFQRNTQLADQLICRCKRSASTQCFLAQYKPGLKGKEGQAYSTASDTCTSSVASNPAQGEPTQQTGFPARHRDGPSIRTDNAAEKLYKRYNKELEDLKASDKSIALNTKHGNLSAKLENDDGSMSPNKVKALSIEKQLVEKEIQVHEAEIEVKTAERDLAIADAYKMAEASKAADGNDARSKEIKATADSWGVTNLDPAVQQQNLTSAKSEYQQQQKELASLRGSCNSTPECGGAGDEGAPGSGARGRETADSGDGAGADSYADGAALPPGGKQANAEEGPASDDNSPYKKGKAIKVVEGACSEAIMAAMANRAAKDYQQTAGPHTKAGYDAYVRANANTYETAARDQYGCESRENWIDNTAAIGDALNMGVGFTAQIAAASATSNAQKSYYENPNDAGRTHQTALREMGKATSNTGKLQIGVGGAQAALSAAQLKFASMQKKRIKEIQAEAGTSYEVEDGQGYSAEGLAAEMVSNMKAGTSVEERNNEGKGSTADSIARMKQIESKGDAAALKSFMQGATNAVAGTLKVVEGQSMIDQANSMTDAVPVNPVGPLAPSSDDGYYGDSVAPPMVSGGTGYDEGFAATAEEIEEEKLANAPLPVPNGGASGGNSGGLKDGQIGGGFNGPTSGPAGTTAGGGGAGGGGSGGTSAKADGPDKPPGADVLTGGGSGKFEGNSGGMAFGAGGAAKRAEGGTGMDLNGLLAQFLPKKDEEEGARGPGILEYGANGNARTPAGDDQSNVGGVLGPNANLFSRISTTTMDYYKKGNLK